MSVDDPRRESDETKEPHHLLPGSTDEPREEGKAAEVGPRVSRAQQHRHSDCEPDWAEQEALRRGFQERARNRLAKKETYEHEQDHDSCTFVTIRRSAWFIRLLDQIHRTSPLHPREILASFSIKNDFMFYPPPKTYCFLLDEEGVMSVGQSNNMANAEDVEARPHSGQQVAAGQGTTKRKRANYEALPKLDARRQVGATHGISGLGTYVTTGSKASRFEMVFVPWRNEVQSYRIVKDEVILEKKITIGGPLFLLSLGCPIPLSIIRPNCRMSSHIAIFFHCNGEDIGHSSCMRLQTLANALHVTILVPEYPGYGLFRGSTSEASVKGAMERVVQFLLSVDGSLTPSRLLLIGHSIGGAVAVHIASYIQEVFEQMQAHYEDDVACPGAYTNELADHGKPTYFESFRLPHLNTDHQPQPSQSLADDDTDADMALASRAAAGGRPPCVLYAGTSPKRNSSSRHSRSCSLSPAAASTGRRDMEPFASEKEANTTEGPQQLSRKGCPPSDSERHSERQNAMGGFSTNDSGASTSSSSASTPAKGQAPTEGARPTKVNGCCRLCKGNRDNGEDERGAKGCASCPSKYRKSTVTHCRHNSLGGIILISSFATLRCVEYVPTFSKSYKLHVTQLEVRRRQVPCDTVFPAPTEWCEDASRRVPPEEMHFCYDEMTTPLMFKFSRFVSFNRFPTVDVMCRLQETYHYFNYTPLLLLHGTDDELISPIHSVALATKLRQCKNGGATARVFVSFLDGGGHNELPCIREIRRFYKDQILTPHLQRQQRFRKKLADLYNSSGCDPLTAPLRGGATPLHPPNTASFRGSDSEKPESTRNTLLLPPAELYFLSHDPTIGTCGGEPPADLSVRPPPPSHHQHQHHSDPLEHNQDDGQRTPDFVTHEPLPSCLQSGSSHAEQSARARHHTALAREKETCGPFILCEPSDFEVDEPGAVVKNTSLLHALEQTVAVRQHPGETAFVPAATILHISMFPSLDRYDVGSVLVAAVRANSLPKDSAKSLYTRHYRLAWRWRIAVASIFLLASLLVLAVGITHAVLCQDGRLKRIIPAGHTTSEYRRDNRILAWSVLEASFLGIVFVMRLLTPMFGLSNVSKERDRHSHTSFKTFSVLHFFAVVLVIGFGIIMGFVLAFTPHERGGVHWARWSELPYRNKVWIAFVPRWLMVGVACWHCLVFTLFLAKNH